MSTDAINDPQGSILLHAAAVADLLDGLIEQYLSASPLTPRQFEIMTVLSVRGPQSPSELAAVTGVPAPSVSRVTGLLERQAMLHGRANPSDRRSRILALTDEGHAAFTAAQAEFRKLHAAVADTLGSGLSVVAFGVRRLEWAIRVVSGTSIPDPFATATTQALHYRGPALDAQEEAEVLDYIEWVRARRRPRGRGRPVGAPSGSPHR
jgi:DNA-binding MarR family transcriptional regulator